MNKDELRMQEEQERLDERAAEIAEQTDQLDWNKLKHVHISKHSRGKQKPKNWRQKRKQQRKRVRASRRLNR